jgi:uncharacterized repeat protein (TIGR01451 family)
MPLAAWAKPSVVVTMSSSREFVATVGGKEVRKVLPAKSVGPGQTIKYTLKYHNQGDEKATNVVINNPVPKDTVYVMGSAAGADSEITFSIDGGKSFKQPTLLSYETTGPNGQVTQKQASPEQYTHVQWIVKEVLPGQEGEVSFQVKVK